MRVLSCVIAAAGLLIPASLLIGQDGGKDGDEKKTASKKTATADNLDDEILSKAKLHKDGAALVQFLKRRTLPESERPAIEALVRRLGARDYRIREKASADLIERGVAVLELLRSASADSLELRRRIERSIQTIQEQDVAPDVPAAVIRVASAQNPAGLIEALIGYLPFADNDAVVDEIRTALAKQVAKAGKADPLLVAALADRAAVRRSMAGEVLGRSALNEHKAAVRKLLADPDASVRFRVARALAFANERDVIPTLIDTLPDLPLNTAWQVDDFLQRLAAGSSPPSAPVGKDRQTRTKCRDAWQAWWKQHGAKVDLAKLEEGPRLLGRTLVVLLDQSKVLELGPDNQPRWEIKGLALPLDAQMIDEDHVLIAEYNADRVSVRNTRGDTLWHLQVHRPLAAQRLANGNTFIASDSELLEYDKDGQRVLHVPISEDQRVIMKAMKLQNGEIVCLLADSRIVRYDARGQELHSFTIELGMKLFGGRLHMLPNGRVIVPHNAEGKVIEYDSRGKILWEVPFEQPIAATRMPNGNTLITSMNPEIGAVEVDRAGVEVWSYRHVSNTRVTRAIRR